VSGRDAKSEKYGLMWMGLKCPEILEYGSFVSGALKTTSVLAKV
jgi:hypothetical protein